MSYQFQQCRLSVKALCHGWQTCLAIDFKCIRKTYESVLCDVRNTKFIPVKFVKRIAYFLHSKSENFEEVRNKLSYISNTGLSVMYN